MIKPIGTEPINPDLVDVWRGNGTNSEQVEGWPGEEEGYGLVRPISTDPTNPELIDVWTGEVVNPE